MLQEKIPISVFRLTLASSCKAVRRGEKELIVTRYSGSLFKVVRNDDKADVAVGLTYMRDRTSKFIKDLEANKTVILCDRGTPLVRCILL